MSGHLAASVQARRFGKPDLARMGRFLREERRAKGLSLRALAAKCGMSAGTIRALEAGQANSSLATVLAVVEALEVDLDRAVEAGRAGRAVVVRRAGDDAAPRLPGAALVFESSARPAKSLGPPLALSGAHPSLGLVVEGAVVAVLREGARHRLETGDVFHAQPGVVQGLAAAGPRPARVMHVVDTRRPANLPDMPGESG